MCSYHKSLVLLLSLVSIDSTAASEIRGALIAPEDNLAASDVNFTSCRPGAPGYINPYDNITATDESSIIGASTTGTTCDNGSAAGYACNNIDLLAYLNLGTFNSQAANDIWGWTDPENGMEYALLGLKEGTAFVDISNPTAPVYLGRLNTHSFSSSWRDIKTYADHAFIVAEAGNHGLQVFDLRQLRGVTQAKSWQETAHYNGFSNAHNIVINEETGLAVAVGTNKCNGGLEMIDVQNPTNPVKVGCYSADGYTHDAQCVIYHGPSQAYEGKEICFAANEDTITIVDVTNRSSPQMLDRKSYANSRYTHQGWLTEDHKTFIANDELDFNKGQTYMFDVSDLTNIMSPIIHQAPPGRRSIMHNEYVKGDFLYQSNYAAGLVILDASNAETGVLEEAAYFNVVSQVSASFTGSWSNYPYFSSGVVVVSSIPGGLFVLKPNLGTPPVSPPPSSPPSASPTSSSNSVVRINNFAVRTKTKSNGKVKSRIYFSVRSTDNVKDEGALVSISFGENPTKTKECTTNARGACMIGLPRFNPVTTPFVMVTATVESSLGVYNPELNKKNDDDCAVFSSGCPSLELSHIFA